MRDARILLLVLLLPACEPRPSAEEIERRVAEQERAAAERKAAWLRSQPPQAPSSTASAAALPALSDLDTPEGMQRHFSAMTHAGRQQAMRDACPVYGCNADRRKAIIDAAPAAERGSLQRLAEQFEAEAVIGRRESFARDLDTSLLNRKLNPDGVSAAGPQKTTLLIRGWFCTRQFAHDFRESPDARQAAALGFTRLECVSPFETWSGGL